MKALVGSWERRPYRLLAELTALRTRVVELERSLAEAREENAALRQLLGEVGASDEAVQVQMDGEREVALTT